jgi:hypothetical protein
MLTSHESYFFWIQVAALVQILFVLTAAADAGWFHFYKYRLHLRPASHKEHLLHTLNALLFPATVYGVFVSNAFGIWLWFVVFSYLATFAIELMDVWAEKRSRAQDGGLEPLESVLHFGMALLRSFVLGIFLATKQRAEFFEIPNSALQHVVPPLWVQTMGMCIIITSIPMALVHVFTYFYTPKRSFS